MKIDKKIIEIWNDEKSINSICVKIYGYYNSNVARIVKKIAEDNNLSFDILKKNYSLSKLKYELVSKICPVCGDVFESKKGHRKEKTTCSHKCSNTYFRSGPENPNWKNDSYRSTCFYYHEKICVICGENKIVDVHHFDEDHNNNSPDNLIPLCPTHHQYFHSKYRNEVEDIIIEYRNKFLK